MASRNFIKEFGYILKSLIDKDVPADPTLMPDVLKLKLTNTAVAATENSREAAGLGVVAHPVSRALYDLGCFFLDKFFDERPIPRFWFLETVARIPYFSYVSMLHLYESFGWLRQPSLRKVHNAEEWNELHHLLIMESMGGDKVWKDRFLGYHCALLYYWLLLAVYAASPRIAYQFMELLEAHAVDTYGTFLLENEALLRSLPPPVVARSYYAGADMYYFDDFQVNQPPGTRRPPCDSLFDVFKNILDDEAEHVSTMQACQGYCVTGKSIVISPHLKEDAASGGGAAAAVGAGGIEVAANSGRLMRERWNQWATQVNSKEGDADGTVVSKEE